MSYIKQRAKRIDSINLLAYICVENDEFVRQGVGRTLNVSQTGILLETEAPIDNSHTILIEIGLEEEIYRAKGKPVYCRPGRNNKYENGIQLRPINEKYIKILKAYINAFRDGTFSEGASIKRYREDISDVKSLIEAEHQIIQKHIIELKKIIEAPDPEIATIQINMLVDFLSQDLSLHFSLEEEVLFAAVLACNSSDDLKQQVERLTKEHRLIESETKKIKQKIENLAEYRKALDDTAIKMISKLIDGFQKHAKFEINVFIPAIDKNDHIKTIIPDFAVAKKYFQNT